MRPTSSSPLSGRNRSPAGNDESPGSAPNTSDGSRSNDTVKAKPKNEKNKKVKLKKKGQSTPIDLTMFTIVWAVIKSFILTHRAETIYRSNLSEVLGGKSYPGEPAWMTALIMSMGLDDRSKPTSRSLSQIYADLANRFGAFTSALTQKLSKGDPRSPNGSPAAGNNRNRGSAHGHSANSQTKHTLEAKIGSKRREEIKLKDEGQSKPTSALGPRINLVINAINDAVAKQDRPKIIHYAYLLDAVVISLLSRRQELRPALLMSWALADLGKLVLDENGLTLVGTPFAESLKSEKKKEDKPKNKEQSKSKKTPKAP